MDTIPPNIIKADKTTKQMWLLDCVHQMIKKSVLMSLLKENTVDEQRGAPDKEDKYICRFDGCDRAFRYKIICIDHEKKDHPSTVSMENLGQKVTT